MFIWPDTRTFFVSDEGIANAILSIHNYPTTFSTNAQGYYTFEYTIQDVKNPPKRLVLKVSKHGFFPLVKVLLVTDNIIDTLRDVYFVMTKIGNGLNFYPSQGIILRTINNAIIHVAPGTQFEDETGNDVFGYVRATLKFMDRDRGIGTSAGEFITEGHGQNLQAFSVFNVVFRDSSFRNVYPAEQTPITVEILNLRIEELTLWQLNDNGRWEQFSQDDGYQIGNAQIVGYLHAKHIGQWIALGQIDDQGLCYVKLRLFEDLTFTSEVRDKQADLYSPDIAMKIVNASHPRSSKALLFGRYAIAG